MSPGTTGGQVPPDQSLLGESDIWEVETPSGIARTHMFSPPSGRARATLVLGHGIGKGVDAPELAAIAAVLPHEGIEVALIEQPWRVRGAKVGGTTATLDAAWVAACKDLRGRGIGSRRLVAGGRSAGARVACRTVEEVKPAALLLLAFPLWPPRRGPFQEVDSRLPELVLGASHVPTVVVQGTRDRLGAPDEIALGLAEANVTARVLPVQGADHSFHTRKKDPLDDAAVIDLVIKAARATALRILHGWY